jgi:PAS domain S-box-containing protein
MADDVKLGRQDLLDLLVAQLTEFVVIVADADGVFTSWHPGVQTHFGYTRDEFIGQSIELLLPITERLRGVGRRELERAAETGRASDTRWLIKKNGQRMLVEGVTIGLRDGAGQLAGYGKVLRDVTERKNTEDSLRAVASALEQSTVMVRSWDGVINHWTAGCERLYGWTAHEAIGHSAHELLKCRYPAPRDQIQEQLLLAGTWKGEVEALRRDGTRMFVSAHWVLLGDGGDEPPTVIETHADITARQQVQHELEAANERLKKMAQELERSNEELEEFARIASHDLSAPLTSTRWLVDLLAARHGAQLSADGQLYINQISQGLQRMGDLVEGVLAHAQVGRTPIGSSELVDAERVLSLAIENLRQQIETSGAVITREPLPAVRLEARALNQLFQNLLSNAIKYRRADVQPAIHVRACREGEMWRFSVADNGIGLAPDWFERIFQPMQRAHGLDVPGSGIGLATCKKIATRAGGSIWVESRVGTGSTFFFTLPGADDQGSDCE